jgi:hypothetical protein
MLARMDRGHRAFQVKGDRLSMVEIPPGKSAAGCGGCEEVFTCVSAFDRHQTMDPAGGTIHHDPALRGLVVYEREVKGEVWSMWGWPASGKDNDWYYAE